MKRKYYKVIYMEDLRVYERFFIRMLEAYNFYKKLKVKDKSMFTILTNEEFATNVDYIPLI